MHRSNQTYQVRARYYEFHISLFSKLPGAMKRSVHADKPSNARCAVCADDEDYLDKQDEFEAAYNFRFEQAEQEGDTRVRPTEDLIITLLVYFMNMLCDSWGSYSRFQERLR